MGSPDVRPTGARQVVSVPRTGSKSDPRCVSRQSTVRFPFAPLELPPYFRGKVTIESALCTGCGACVRDCPAFALELERESDALSSLVLSKAEGSKGREEFRLIHYHDRQSSPTGGRD